MKRLVPLALLALAGCEDMCANDVIDEAISPDGAHRAVLFERDCSATTGFSTQVSILEPRDVLEGSGNVFVADDVGTDTKAEWGGPWAEVEWTDDENVVVRYDAKARVFEMDDSASGVSVTFEKVAR